MGGHVTGEASLCQKPELQSSYPARAPSSLACPAFQAPSLRGMSAMCNKAMDGGGQEQDKRPETALQIIKLNLD